MKLARDLSVLFAVLIAMALLAYGAFKHRITGILLLWLALLVLVFALLALVLEIERLNSRVEGLESSLRNRREGEGRGLEG